MEKLTREEVKKIAEVLNPHINLPKIPELLEGWMLRIIISIIDTFLFKKLPEDIYGLYKELILMVIEGTESEKIEAKKEVLAYVPDEYIKRI